jgi:hypothetical protein
VREQIIDEIRRLANANGGQPPGVRLFEKETGIRESAWRGVYWARWGDAVREAGFEPNIKQEKFEEKFFLTKLAESCRHFHKFPTAMELRMYKRTDAEFPNVKSITRHFGSLTKIPPLLAEWAKSNTDYSDVVAVLDIRPSAPLDTASLPSKEGLVYLIKSGAHYKIGRSDELERRVKEIRIALPEAATLVHSIRTDDPSGIETYWHRRFADRRAKGEWFKLTNADVAAFKRRRYQ